MAENKDETSSTKAERNSKITVIISTLKAVLLLEYLSGIFRFTFKEGELLPPNYIKKIYALFLIVFYVSLYFTFLDLPTMLNGSYNLVQVMDEAPCAVMLIQYVTTLITTNVFLGAANKEIFAMLADLDIQLVTTNSEEFYRKARSKTNNFMLILIASHITISVVDLLTEEDYITISLLIFLPLCLVQKIEIVAFCMLIEMLKTRLDIINGYITKFLDEKDGDRISVFTLDNGKGVKDTINVIGTPSENNMKIRDLGIMYDMIGTISSTVNCVFNFQIFMTLVSTFTYIVITMWTSLYYYQTPAEDSSGSFISVVIWCLGTLLTVVVMCFVCERLRMSRNKTSLLVNQIVMDYKLPKVMRMQAKAFMELIEAWPLCIMVYDMFSVDITLILKFISVSTTYLIVIIQVTHFL